jgi:hypothetical protein
MSCVLVLESRNGQTDAQPVKIIYQAEKQTYAAYKTKTKLRDFSPQANYTDRATAACRRS